MACLAGLMASLVAGCWLRPDPAIDPPPARTPLPPPSTVADRGLPTHRAIAAEGARYFARYCTECHGSTGAGDGAGAALLDPPPISFRDPAYMRDQTPAYYFRAITDGVVGSAMAPWDPQLDEQARWDTAFYVWALSTNPDDVERGESIYASSCARCHGSDGAGISEARLDDPARVARSRADVVAVLRRTHADSAPMDPAAMEALIAYVWTFLYEPESIPGGHLK
jgi:mono/diheme cytochrome c family protein